MVDGASSLAKKFNISELAIGFTVVAMGTSAPEFVVNLISGLSGHDEVVFGNIIGSNMFNTFLILGITGMIYPLYVKKDTVKFEIPFSIIITFLLFTLINDELFSNNEVNEASRADGVILLTLFIMFLLYVYFNLKKAEGEFEESDSFQEFGSFITLLMIGGGIFGLILGGKLVVDNAVKLAHLFGMSEKLIGLTIIAAGTSLPELVTSATAAFRKKSDMAMGNILGSNIFNILFVLGVSTIVVPLKYDNVMNNDLYILIAGTIGLFIFMFTSKRKRLDRWESIALLSVFFLYMTYIIIRN